MLDKHSGIRGSKGKELHYFDRDPFNPGWSYQEYHSYFKGLEKGKLYFEATPSYLYHPEAAKRICRYNPKMKIMIILRDPAERALSAWTMYHYRFKTDGVNFQYYDEREFDQAIEDELKVYKQDTWLNNKRSYINRGIYHEQIKRYTDLFPIGNILILESSELSRDRSNTIRRVCDFLALPYEDLVQSKGNESIVANKEDYQGIIKKLREFYKPHNEQLYKMIDKSFNWDK
jgi:hypothetical protein